MKNIFIAFLLFPPLIFKGQHLISTEVEGSCSSGTKNSELFNFNEELLINSSYIEGDTLEVLSVSLPEGETAIWNIFQNLEVQGDIIRLSGSLNSPGKFLSISSQEGIVSGQYENYEGVFYNLVGCGGNTFVFEDAEIDLTSENSCVGPEVSI